MSEGNLPVLGAESAVALSTGVPTNMDTVNPVHVKDVEKLPVGKIMMSESLEATSPAVTRDAASTKNDDITHSELTNAPEASAMKDHATVGPATSYFIEGEMLPWKGKWFKVRLITMPDGERLIGLAMQKDTSASLKRAERRERWKKQHPKAVSPRYSRSSQAVSSAVA